MENESSSPLARAARALMEADWVLVASGAGLSAWVEKISEMPQIC